MKRTALFLIALALATGCAAQTEDKSGLPAPDSLEQGLTVLEAEQGISFAAAYKKGDVAIYLQALRGQPTPEVYQKSPDSPKYEVDARFVADNGRIFFTQKGGDDWIDPTWAEDLERQGELPPTTESNELLFEMASDAATLLNDAIPPEIGAEGAALTFPELTTLRAMGEQAPATFDSMKVRLVEHRKQLDLPDLPEVEYGSDDKGGTPVPDWSTGANYYYIAVHDAVLSTSLDLGCLWDTPYHSATRLYQWNGSWAFAHDSCNHGRCPNEMGQRCLLQYTEAVVDYKPAWTMMSCNQTGYNAFSNDGHNCHDDTRTQMASFVYGNGHNKNPGTKFWCKDDDSTDISCGPFGGEQDGHPNCDASTNRGYNHPDMCRNQNATGYNAAGGCYCDAGCTERNDCCLDGPYVVATGCHAENTCGGYASAAGCWCDTACATYGDCCSDGPC